MSLEKLRKKLEKEFKNAIKKPEDIVSIPTICSFGSIALDVVSGVGGLPKGRIIEMLGNPSGGKTTLAMLTIAEGQKIGKVAAFLDLENSFDPKWFQNLGGKITEDLFILIKPESGAAAYEIMDSLVESEEVDIIVADSVAAIATEAEIEADYASATMAQLARLMSSGLKKINNTMIKHDRASIIFINQLRSSINQYAPDEGSGGNALRFYSSMRLYVRRSGGKEGIIGESDNPEGFRTAITLRKNKLGVPLRTIETNLYVGTKGKFGIDKDEELIDVAVSIGLIERLNNNKETEEFEIDEKGSYYRINNETFYGYPRFKKYLDENKDVFDKLKPAIYTFIKQKQGIMKPEPESFDAAVHDEIKIQMVQQRDQKKERKNRKGEVKEEEIL